MDSINQGVVVVDEFDQLVAWNDEFLRLYKLGKTALYKGMGIRDFSDLFLPSDNDGQQAKPLSVNGRLGGLKSGEYFDVLADGTAIEIKVSTRDSGGLIATYTDVTSHISTEARLRRQRKLLEEQVTQLQTLGRSLEEARSHAVNSDQQKSRFLAMISHDIRTPMSAIISSLELLSSDQTGGDRERLLQVALASGRQMLFLLSDIIEVSRSDGWNFTVEVDDVRIGDLLASIVEAWQPYAARKPVQLHLAISESVPKSLQTDPKRLRQVIDNLLSNALKFTDVGKIVVHVDTVDGHKGERIRVRVEDSGRGISRDMQHRLFQEFGRIENAGAPKVEGTGLGLSICKRIVESLNGDISVESVEGAGSVFSIELPCVRSRNVVEAYKAAPPEERAQPAEGRTLRILVADDNEINRIVLSAMLDRLGCSSTQAADGQEAFNLLQTEDFDVVLMDHYMPFANGDEVTRWIRALDTSKNAIPVIGITASEDDVEHKALIDAGMTATYTKPLREADLASMLQKYVR
ncbi:ATP-binding protein [Thioclava sp. FR2]|uniref:ATP-binding protein n=1 Tax=Thioclava sp. FR2 TaxID=3445780 RepID=UPI003EB6ACAC